MSTQAAEDNREAPILVSAEGTCFLRRTFIMFAMTFQTQTIWQGGRNKHVVGKCVAAPVFTGRYDDLT